MQSKTQEAQQETVSAVAMYTKREDPQTMRMEPRGFEPRVVPNGQAQILGFQFLSHVDSSAEQRKW